MISSAILLPALAVAGTSLDIYKTQQAKNIQKTELENRKIQQRTQAAAQSTKRVEDMARSISSSHNYAAANGMTGSSGYSANLSQNQINATQDLAQIESNLAAREAGLDIQQEIVSSKASARTRNSIFDLAFDLFDSYSRPEPVALEKPKTQAKPKADQQLSYMQPYELADMIDAGTMTPDQVSSYLRKFGSFTF